MVNISQYDELGSGMLCFFFNSALQQYFVKRNAKKRSVNLSTKYQNTLLSKASLVVKVSASRAGGGGGDASVPSRGLFRRG